MRIFLLFPALALIGCGSNAPGETVGGAPPGETDRIECRLGNEAAFERSCRVERAGDVILVRKPDGGFRRLRIVGDGRGVIAADGAEEARVTIVAGDAILVEIGGDAFRLPARVAAAR